MLSLTQLSVVAFAALTTVVSAAPGGGSYHPPTYPKCHTSVYYKTKHEYHTKTYDYTKTQHVPCTTTKHKTTTKVYPSECTTTKHVGYPVTTYEKKPYVTSYPVTHVKYITTTKYVKKPKTYTKYHDVKSVYTTYKTKTETYDVTSVYKTDKTKVYTTTKHIPYEHVYTHTTTKCKNQGGYNTHYPKA